MAPPPAVILAGGRARRMGGGDKLLLEMGGAPILDHILARLRPQAGPIAISANGDPARFARFGLPVLPDPLPDFPGPLAGILAAMIWAEGLGADAVVSVAGDTPFLPEGLVAGLNDSAADSGIALAADHDAGGALRLHPTFGLWPVALRGALKAALADGVRRIRQFAVPQGFGTALFEAAPEASFFNINTPEDLAAARARAPALRK
ncbi:molybdenum cofactor guanylyltransferase MobA [Paracoccus sediminicola]|nr:molybdenum cofactor guanylyltransferase MobA [Paracoccus sediminicola]WBU58328.1 molybdenum cofactor guanylyltransferase MobA [Paracoccus sediminicola]